MTEKEVRPSWRKEVTEMIEKKAIPVGEEVPEGVLMKVRSCPCPCSIQVAFPLLSGCHEVNGFASSAPLRCSASAQTPNGAT